LFYLPGSIILTASLVISFKIIERFRIPVSQAIVFNYLTCVITGSLLNGAFPVNKLNIQQPWFLWALVTGSIFISLFNLIGYSAQKLGVAITSVSNKLSLVIPFVFSIYLYNEKVTWMKVAGIALAVLAVILTCKTSKKGETSAHHHLSTFQLIKFVEQRFLHLDNSDAYLVTAFSAAGVIGTIVMLASISSGKMKFDRRSILAGIAIGIPNYFSIWCLVRVLREYKGESSVIIPVNNMGIVLLSSIVAWLLFKETLTLINWVGIMMSVAALALIALS
jgi:drug/metabolite transporter (DMT)-like permease